MDDKLICKICGREFKKFRGLAYHVNMIHHTDSKDYYDLYFGKGFCKTCGKESKYYGIQTGYTIFCSTKCSNADPEIKKILTEGSKNWWKDHKKPKIVLTEKQKQEKNIITSKNRSIAQLKRFSKIEEIEKISLSQKEHYKNMDESKKLIAKEKNKNSQIIRYSNPEERKKQSVIMKKCNENNPELRELSRQRCLNGHALIMIKAIKKISNEELKLREMVKELYPDCEFQYSIFREKGKRNYSLDIAILEHKIAIEYDGYYHFNCQENIEYHKNRHQEIENKGWKFYVVTMFDQFPTLEKLKEDINEVIKK